MTSAQHGYYELIPHTADSKISVYASSLPDLFKFSLKAMFEICAPQKKFPIQAVSHDVSLTASKLDYLLVDFLSECLSLSDINNEAYDNADIELLTCTHIMAKIYGYKISKFDSFEIKAVTYHDLQVHQTDTGWNALIVFDI